MRVNLALLLQEPHTTFLPNQETAFLARVQLTNCDNYDGFHDRMAEQGFSRSIKDLAGKQRHLPDATYFIAEMPEKTVPQTVFGLVKRAIDKHKISTDQMNIDHQVIVVAASDAWFELPELIEDEE
ncbi:hypothetical protein ACQKQA_10605 [Pseudomonas sp. NPDC089530]|uniref:hypothetical protein n=1 Tax=Pseudomonas sp. NPDC089530 TaxID=3390651 RepID=UPI003D04F64A